MLNGYSNRVEGGVKINGYDQGGVGKILAENETHIVVKWPAHTYWYVRGGRAYASPVVVVYRKSMAVPPLGNPRREAYEWFEGVIEYGTGRGGK